MHFHHQLSAIGNALIDLEYQVTDEFIQQTGWSKGSMHLMDGEQFEQTLVELRQNFALAKRCGGGSAANSAVVFSQLGGSAQYFCQLGDDEQGAFYRQDLLNQSLQCHSTVIQQPSGQCLVLVTPDAERTMLTHLGASAMLSSHSMDLKQLDDTQWLLLEGYMVSQPESFELAKQVIRYAKTTKTNGIKIALSLSDPLMIELFNGQMNDLVGLNSSDLGVDLIFANEQEACLFSGKANIDEAMTALHELAETVVITRGSSGSMVIMADQMIETKGVEVEVLDSNGAGDAFAGAFLYGISNGLSAQQTCQLANRLAAQMVSQFGARLPKASVDACVADMAAEYQN